MKSLKIFMSLFSVMLCASLASGQTYSDESMNSLEKIQNKSFQYNFMASQNPKVTKAMNATKVQQIGDYNRLYSITQSSSSDIQYTQIGKENDILNNASAQRIEENVVQIGNNHGFTDLNNVSSRLHAANIFQYGTNQNLIWIGGQNSISEKMMVSMKGQNQTVIVRNLNN